MRSVSRRSRALYLAAVLAGLLLHTPAARASCAAIGVGGAPVSGCAGTVKFTVSDPEANLDPGALDTILINARSATEPAGELFVLTETGLDTGVFEGFVPVSAQLDTAGVLFQPPGPGGPIVGSYVDAGCDGDADGELGENDFTDVDGDGIPNLGPNGRIDSRWTGPFDDDNCFEPGSGTDVANPAQDDTDRFCTDAAGATDGTACLTDLDCTVTPGFDTCRADRVGDACDNCPYDYNPGQADADADGVGDACELDGGDLDVDGVPNEADNCPTVFNPAQEDTGTPGVAGNGIGDACDGPLDRDPEYAVVILPGANGVLDSAVAPGDVAPGDGTIRASVDRVASSVAAGDDIQVLAPGAGQDCDPGTIGINGDGIVDADDNCPDVCNDDQIDTDGDGIGDACDWGEDYDGDSFQNVVDTCPVWFNFFDQTDSDGDGRGDVCDPDSDDDDNDGAPDDLPQAELAVSCDSIPGALEIVDAVISDAGSGDGDGFADPGETLTLDLTVRNTSGGALTNLALLLGSDSPTVGCLLDASASYGTLAAGATATNPAGDRFQFLVDPGTATLDLDAREQAVFFLTARADELAGVGQGSTYTLFLDLDVLGDPTGGGPLDGTGAMSEGFEGLSGTPDLANTLGRSGLALSEVIPVVPWTTCAETPPGPPDCSVDPAQNDWHLHDLTVEPANAPGLGLANTGTGSLHLGRHLDTFTTTYRFRQLTAFLGPPVNVDLSGDRKLEFWQIIHLADWRSVSWPDGETGDIAMLQVRLDEEPDPLVDAFGPWQRVEPSINGYATTRSVPFPDMCWFDPTDDANASGAVPDQTTCHPESGWTRMGVFGNTCDPCDGNPGDCWQCGDADFFHNRAGDTGFGVWSRTTVDLVPLSGRRVQFRWLFSSLAVGIDQYLSYDEPAPGYFGFPFGKGDDGWFVDDIRFTGLLQSQLQLVPDGGDDEVAGSEIRCGPNATAETRAEGDDVQVLPLGAVCAGASDVVVLPGGNGLLDSVGRDTCPADPAGFCLGATARINGVAAGTFATGGPGQPLLLNGTASILSPCANGAPLYEYAECGSPVHGDPCDPPLDASVIRGASFDGFLEVAPAASTRYRLAVRCSSQPDGTGCVDATEAVVLVYPPPSEAGEIEVTGVTCSTADSGDPGACDGADRATFDFLAAVQGGGFDGYSLHRFGRSALASPVISGAVCVASGFGSGAAPGAPLGQVEPVGFTPAPGQAAYFVIAHREAVPGGPSPAGLARPSGAGPAPRFVDPACP